jgi:prephenate dehydratase
MTTSIAYLGPEGTYAEAAALSYANLLHQAGQETVLCPCASIALTLDAIVQSQTHCAVVPIENSIQGSVTVTLDSLWQLDILRIQQALVMPISHALISTAAQLDAILEVHAHPQALAQCQQWLAHHLPNAKLISTNSNAEALKDLNTRPTLAAIAGQRAAALYQLPVLAHPINDYPENCTRFLVMSREPSPGGSHTSIAFSVSANQPGMLVKPLQIFADQGINLSRIESRPTKRSLGDYLFFVDLEADAREPVTQAVFEELAHYTETLKIFGSYDILTTAL